MSSPAVTKAVPAASTFDRRSFLATLAAAGVLTGAAVPALAADKPDGNLLELVAALFAATAHWDVIDGEAEAQAIWDRCEALMPPIPEALFFQEDRDTWEICYDPKRLTVTDIDGVARRHYTEERHVPRLRWAVGIWRREGTGKGVVDRAEEILAALDPYMAAVEQAEAASGVTAFHERSGQNQDAINRLQHEISATPALTVEGLTAKARAAAIVHWSDDLSYLADDVLPKLLKGSGPYADRPEIVAALSVVVDAMKLGAPSNASVAA